MQRPLTSRTIGVRAVVFWAIRAVGVALVCYGTFLILARLVFGLFLSPDYARGVFGGVKIWMGIAEDHGWVRGWPMLTVGGVLCLASRPLSRWIIAMPDQGCPRCGYAGTVSGGRCPECGLEGLQPIAGDAPTRSAD
ncbi:MAG: hypothetical protein KDA31_04155 [Phycisphaerales bacterium]|nr:hypothetical protein [Phycisphaerales bacterium]MCB9835248.1 hypothetical protein [Phycisphaera sp.]